MRFVNCTNFIVSALVISHAFELKFSLIVYVMIVIYDSFVQGAQEMRAHFRSYHQMASYIM